MFSWLKRKAQLAIVNSAEQDIDRFLASLRGASLDDLCMIVALTTHWCNVFKADGIDLLDPSSAEAKNPSIGITLNRFIRDEQKDNPTFAVGLMVWLHTIRAVTIPEIRYKGRMIWAELSKGFNGANEAGISLAELSGVQLCLDPPVQIPIGLESDHRAEKLFNELLPHYVLGEKFRPIRVALSSIGIDIKAIEKETFAAESSAEFSRYLCRANNAAITDDDTVYVAGIFTMVAADHFSRLVDAQFEISSSLALLQLVGEEELGRVHDTVIDGFNGLTTNRPKVIQAIGQNLAKWINQPTPENLDPLERLFGLLRNSVAEV